MNTGYRKRFESFEGRFVKCYIPCLCATFAVSRGALKQAGGQQWHAQILRCKPWKIILCLAPSQVRAGEAVDNSELVKFAQLFNDELTLDNLERIHLVNLCRFVGITPFGTDEFLRARLRSQLAAIKVCAGLR